MTGRPAVNLLWCVPGVVGGTEPYLVRQLLGLVEIGIGRHARPVLHCLRSFADAHPELLAEFDARLAPVSGRLRALRVGAEHSWLANATRSASLVHHAGGTVPALGRGPVVLTIHDLQYLHLPGNFSAPKRRYLQATVPRSVRRADVIATPTRFVAATVIEGFGVDQASCVVVPHSLPATAGAWGGDADGLRRRYGLGEHPVAVYPAITHPHKNHRFLVDLLASGLVDDELRLVLIGGAGAAEIGLRSAIRSAGVAERVIRPGRVSDADRDGLIAIADAMVFPSCYEGFGVPVIEAMALGTPVVCSDRAALPEVVGDGGLVTPLDVDAWATALATVGARGDELAAAGRARLAHFSAERSAGALWRAYRTATQR